MSWEFLSAGRPTAYELQSMYEWGLKCPHANVYVYGPMVPFFTRTDHGDGKGYTVRQTGEVRQAWCRDCNLCVIETEPGSGVYKLRIDE